MSLEVLSDDLDTMEKKALKIAGWSDSIRVKIPIIKTKNEPTGPLIKKLSSQGITLNVTVVSTEEQATTAARPPSPEVSSYISIFAGRIAENGVDPVHIVGLHLRRCPPGSVRVLRLRSPVRCGK